MSSLQIGKVIYQILHEDEDLVARVHDKVFPLIATRGINNEDITFPFIVYRRESIEPADTKDRFICKCVVTVSIVVASDKYNDTIEISDIIVNALQGYKGQFDTIDIKDIKFSEASEDYIDDTFIQQLNFNIYTNG